VVAISLDDDDITLSSEDEEAEPVTALEIGLKGLNATTIVRSATMGAKPVRAAASQSLCARVLVYAVFCPLSSLSLFLTEHSLQLLRRFTKFDARFIAVVLFFFFSP